MGVSKTQTTDLENAMLSKTQTSEMQTLQTLFSKNTDAAQTLQKITAFARERIMAAMNLNPLVCLFFFFSRSVVWVFRGLWSGFSRYAFSRHPISNCSTLDGTPFHCWVIPSSISLEPIYTLKSRD